MTVNKLIELIRDDPAMAELKKTGKTSFAGMVGSAAAALIASLAKDLPGILVITSTSGKAEALRSEIGIFSNKDVRFFPAPDTIAGEGFAASKELIGERLAVLGRWGRGMGGVVVAPVKAVMWKTAKALRGIELKIGRNQGLDDLIQRLVSLGYKRFDVVGEHGEFSVRGGIIDIFPLNLEQPVRVELAGDEIASLRTFDAYSQRSVKKVDKCAVLPAKELFEVPVFEHVPANTLILFDEPMEIARAADRHIEEQKTFSSRQRYLSFDEMQKLAKKGKVAQVSSFVQPGEKAFCTSSESYVGRLAEIPAGALIISKHAARLREEMAREVVEGSLRGGFILDGVQVLSDRELFGEEVVFHKVSAAPREGVADELLADLKPGDFVVHENYGIGLYQGMKALDIDGLKQEYLLLEYAGGDKVYVPPGLAGMVEKYSSGGDYRPKLSRLGTKQWGRIKDRVKKELRDMTKELLEVYAARQKLPGFSFPADDVWQKELAATFPYEETPDQNKAILAAKRDMEAPRPMDRLICGDVGYGKTEVALRAAAKAVSSGKQVAVLVPTTILAEQHFNNFKERFRSSPFVIEMLSRFRSKKEQDAVARSLAGGGVDMVVGTHRLFSKDIKFKDLGLLIVDEEQRFGVAHKEKLKKLKKTVDVMTMSATPIPRTLYLSLSGARDMSVINTPPLDRSPIRTYVLPWSEAVIREAILRELDRGGQVYFVHNVVETIPGVASRIRKLVPEARITVGHGQMPEKKLEKTMIDFLDRKFDVLVCTSIIESGLDITNVNTILIDQADRFGLSQLYQIRGRVGRSAARAYAYLFYHPARVMTDQALERLKAIQEFTALGSGYKLAMRDLEIRGAGNLLGAEQSGHILEVGFDLYCELLDEAVREAKGIEEISPREVVIDLKVDASIPSEYVVDDRQRIALYRRMNLLSSRQEVEEMKKELIDRFGQYPEQVERLFDILYLKVKALQAGVKSIKEEGGNINILWQSGRFKRVRLKGKDKVKLAELSIAQ